MTPELQLVHLQLTKNCNLRCWFCGQWGNHGFFSDASGSPMDPSDWDNVLTQLVAYREETGISPDIMLWGGEPLLYPHFGQLAYKFAMQGFRLGIVTNGTMIDRHLDVLREHFHHIYVSVDGNREIHDKIRGAGVFDKVASNLALLRGGKAKISIMSVISSDNLSILPQLPETLCALDCDEVLLQEMIYVTREEAADYKRWMLDCFKTEAAEIESWIGQPVDEEKKQSALSYIHTQSYSKPVIYLPHGVADHPCLSPFSHIHIAWNGNVLYCTDFYDFSAGNVKSQSIIEIFHNEKSDLYRKEIQLGHCVTCEHCSWKNSTRFSI